MKYEFSIVIPTYNGERTIGKLLEKLSYIPEDYNTEIIVIDSSSTDKTPQIVRKFQTKILNVRFFTIKKEDFNHGGTRNMGVRLAKGKYVCFFSQDAIPINNNFLKYYSEDFALDRKVVAVFGKQISKRKSSFIQKIELKGVFYKLDKLSRNKGILLQIRSNPFVTFNRENHFLWYALLNPFSCYKRTFLRRYPFPQVEYAEDLQMGKYIIDNYYAKIYDPRCIVIHSHDYGLWDYYKRQRVDYLAKSQLYRTRTNFTFKLKQIIKSNESSLKKLTLIIYLIFYYLIKAFVFFEFFLR